MKKGIKTFLKIFGALIGLLFLLVVFFVFTNWTLVKNFPTAQDGFADAMYIENQKPLQLIGGTETETLNLNLKDKDVFSETHKLSLIHISEPTRPY